MHYRVYSNDPAPTDIYTYRHTLSRHDALPICPGRGDHPVHDPRRAGRRRPHRGLAPGPHREGLRIRPGRGRTAGQAVQGDAEADEADAWDLRDEEGARQGEEGQEGQEGRPGHGRSEEHTSELQSLMRISYAVFCLKKINKEDIVKDKANMVRSG